MGAYFGYSGQTGGYPGGQAEYLRVPFANFTHFKIPESCEEPDEKLSVIADAMTTGFWSVDNAGVKRRYSYRSRLRTSRPVCSKVLLAKRRKTRHSS